MEDFEMTLSSTESAKIHLRLGEAIPKESISIHVWSESENRASVAISVNGEERHVIEISDRGRKIKTT